MTTAITEQRQPAFSLAPKDLDEALRFAEVLSKSSIVPKDYQGNAGNVLVAMQWGMELGLQPLQAMQNIAVINGRPSIWGDAMLALVRGSGLLEKIDEDISDTVCTCKLKRKGEEAISRSFSLEEAKRAGLFEKAGPWKSYPKRMMQMRARAFALRDAFPDVLKGIHIAEESQDMPPEKDMGQADVVESKTKTEALKDLVAGKKQAAAHIFDEVMKAIEKAATPEDMKMASDMAARLTDPKQKEQARQAYADKIAEAKKSAATETESDTDPQSFTFAEVNNRLVKAKTADELNEAASLITLVLNPAHQEELRKVYENLKKPK